MAHFEGTTGDDTLTLTSVSAGVTSSPSGSLPGNEGDSYYLYNGNDVLWSGNGDDFIVAHFGDDEVHAGDGDDEIWEFVAPAVSGDDTFFGEGGNDQIEGGGGDDLVDGGEGNDTIFGGGYFNPDDEDGNDVIFGRQGSDVLIGNLGSDDLYGGDGDDRVFADRETGEFDSLDVLQDNAANRLFGGNGLDLLIGALGADRLHGNDGDDTLKGATGNDYLDGGAGNDHMVGGDGRDTCYGRAGDDQFDFTADDYDYVLRSESVDGGRGRDSIELWFIDDLKIDLQSGSVTSSESKAKLSLVSIETAGCGAGFTVRGSDAANSVWGTGESTFWGLGGNDDLQCDGVSLVGYGGTGNDTLIGGSDRDRLFGEDGADTLHGRNGNDLLCGGDGNDWLYGNAGHGVGGGAGTDQMFGGAGNDVLQGNFNSDQLYGGAGRDTFQYIDPADSKYEDIDHIRGGTPAGGPGAGAIKVAFEAPGKGKGDIIDLKAIDADDNRDGNQPFIFGTQRQGGLWLKDIGNVTVVQGNIDPDENAELVIYIHDGAGVRAEDYTAADFIL